MEAGDNTRTITEARGCAELGMHLEAWELIESLPPARRTDPAAAAVRLLVCTGLRKWEMGKELVRLIGRHSPIEEREAAGQFHLADAEARCSNGDIVGAKDAVRALAVVWPQGRALALNSPALAVLW